MPETGDFFPPLVKLNEVDHFLLQLDRSMRQAGGGANVCTFVITLRGRLPLEELQHRLEADPVYRWVTSLRLCRRLFRKSRWQPDAQAGLPEIQVHEPEEAGPVPESLLAMELAVSRESPLKIDLIPQGGDASLLIFTWHHALMDAHGGEFLVRHLGACSSGSPLLWQPPRPPALPWRQRAVLAREMKSDLYAVSKPPLLVLHGRNEVPGRLRYRLLRFSTRQTRLIGERARDHGATFLTSAFYLAATACALARLKRHRGDRLQDVLVPVPQDRRRRGADGPVIGNQVSFLFYRIQAEALGDLARCTASVVAQMQEFIRSRMPERYLVMMGLLRHLPSPLYRVLLRSPTEGAMGSCFFSDTGEVLAGCRTLFDHEVREAVHYPPNIHPPGLTFVFSRFQETLQVTFAVLDGVVNEAESEYLLAALRRYLLGKTDDAL